MARVFNPELVRRILQKCWSRNSSTLWTETNPAKGQCSATSLVVHIVFGGTILKTKVDNQWHFYNNINDTNYDFTDSQFENPCQYLDIPSSPEECLTDTSELQYKSLLRAFNEHLS
jgi:hypothetical protein